MLHTILHRKRMKFSLAALLVLLTSWPVAAEQVELSQRWYSVLLADQPVGYLHTLATRDAENRITTTSEMHLTIRRDRDELIVLSQTRFIETADHKPVLSEVKLQVGANMTTTTMRFTDGGIELTTDNAAPRMLPHPEQAWLTPAATEKLLKNKLEMDVREFGHCTLDASNPSLVCFTHKFIAPRDVEVMGKVVPATEAEMISTSVPGAVQRVFYDLQGHIVKMQMSLMPGMSLDIVQAEEQIARAKVNPPELMSSTVVKLAGAIPGDARSLRTAVYELKLSPADDGRMHAPSLPGTGYQQVVWSDEGTCIVVIDLDTPVPPGRDLPTDEHLHSSRLINSDDVNVVNLSRQMLKNLPKDAGEADKAEHIRKFVHGFVRRKDLSVGMASAAEVAMTRQGDCTEHAMLLAALLRTQKIPSRVATGLVYVPSFMKHRHVFMYHMWTQAWLDGPEGGKRWVDLDATLKQPFDAAHITLAVSAFDDMTANNDMLRLASVIGRVSIRVIEPARDDAAR